MENTEIWRKNQEIEQEVDRIFAESDARVFEILHKIAKLAVEDCLSG